MFTKIELKPSKQNVYELFVLKAFFVIIGKLIEIDQIKTRGRIKSTNESFSFLNSFILKKARYMYNYMNRIE